jgi:3-oxoacyl-(acyl-carrier-protein) synthase
VGAFGSLCALGAGADAYAALLDGRCGLRPSTFDVPLAVVDARIADGPRTSALALALFDGLQVDGAGLAVVFATTTAAMRESEPALEAWAQGRRDGDPRARLWNLLAHHPADAVARRFGATGPVLSVSTACTSGTTALGVGVDLLRAERCRRVLVVGADALCRTTVAGFRSLGVHTRATCRPFDRARDGMALGEAAAFLLLEPSCGRGFEIVGVGTTSDAFHLTAPDPEGLGLMRAIDRALAGHPREAVDHVNAHGTGTAANDVAEAAALARAAPRALVSATKGATGHTLGAAGVLEAVFTLQSMQTGKVPPVVGLLDPLPVDVSDRVRDREQRLAVSVNVAFGGHNAAVAFRVVP